MEGTMMMMMNLPSVCRTTWVRADQHQGDERWTGWKWWDKRNYVWKPKFQRQVAKNGYSNHVPHTFSHTGLQSVHSTYRQESRGGRRLFQYLEVGCQRRQERRKPEKVKWWNLMLRLRHLRWWQVSWLKTLFENRQTDIQYSIYIYECPLFCY